MRCAVGRLGRQALRARMRMRACSGAAPSGDHVRIGLCQMMVGADKAANIETARRQVSEAAAGGAQLVALPEIWNGPYATTSFPEYAEPVPDAGVNGTDGAQLDAAASPSSAMLCAEAKRHGVHLVGGSISERDGEAVYNTCIVVSPGGVVLAKHRKMHLFDIDVPGKITFKESDTLSAGDSVTTFEMEPFGRVGVGICYDIRFPEQAMLMRSRGCSLLVYPGAFNMTTGPAHWELLQRARAVDNQCFVATVSPARNPDADYQAWGHSTVVGPWGEGEATTEHGPAVIFADVEVAQVHSTRSSIPTWDQKRTDLYQLRDC